MSGLEYKVIEVLRGVRNLRLVRAQRLGLEVFVVEQATIGGKNIAKAMHVSEWAGNREYEKRLALQLGVSV